MDTKVEVDWSGSGLVVQLIETVDGQPILVSTYSAISDAEGHFTEAFIGAMARRITELEEQLNGSSNS